MHFEQEIEAVLPADLPNRSDVVVKTARHLAMVVAVNEYMNLTRIVSPREAAIKHVLDCVVPWRYFANSKRILDAGTGAGFPGIPLSLVMPDKKFFLVESIQKKARFVESVVDELDLKNIAVHPDRAEHILSQTKIDLITARALAPIGRAIELFLKPMKQGTKVLLYRGRDAVVDVEEARPVAQKARVYMRVVHQYSLPDDLGLRTIVEMGC